MHRLASRDWPVVPRIRGVTLPREVLGCRVRTLGDFGWRISLPGRMVLLVTSILLSLGLAEIAVRVHIWSRPVSFHVVQSVYGQYDPQFGERFLPTGSC
jgi:hypothetical protein